MEEEKEKEEGFVFVRIQTMRVAWIHHRKCSIDVAISKQ